jgi:hypothetical protein
MILATITVYLIEREFHKAAYWAIGAALLSCVCYWNEDLSNRIPIHKLVITSLIYCVK